MDKKQLKKFRELTAKFANNNFKKVYRLNKNELLDVLENYYNLDRYKIRHLTQPSLQKMLDIEMQKEIKDYA